jgi:geranylgeranyl pyrophosphate synthase
LEPDDVRQVINILNEKSALEHAEEMIRSHCRQAMESLKNVGISPWGLEELEKLCEHITAWDDKAWQNER